MASPFPPGSSGSISLSWFGLTQKQREKLIWEVILGDTVRGIEK